MNRTLAITMSQAFKSRSQRLEDYDSQHLLDNDVTWSHDDVSLCDRSLTRAAYGDGERKEECVTLLFGGLWGRFRARLRP